MINLVLFGKPGAGKGTQAEFLKSHYRLFHISTGDVFRYNIKNETALGKLAKSYMDKGDLVPDEVTIEMLEAEVEKILRHKALFLMDFQEQKPKPQVWMHFLVEKKWKFRAL